jgi:hypothetical protein
LDGAAGRRRATELLALRPDATLRQVAREAGISLSTARDVRQRLRRKENPIPSRQRRHEDSSVTAHECCDSNGSLRVPSSSIGMPNIAGSGAGRAKYSSVKSPCHEVIAMTAAIPAPVPFAWHASKEPDRAWSVPAASGSTRRRFLRRPMQPSGGSAV